MDKLIFNSVLKHKIRIISEKEPFNICISEQKTHQSCIFIVPQFFF